MYDAIEDERLRAAMQAMGAGDSGPLLAWIAVGDPAAFVPSGSGTEPAWSILHAACAHGAVRVVRAVLDRGVDPDLRDVHGDPPLYFALTCAGSTEVADALLAAGAALHVRSEHGHALHWACAGGRLDLVQRLVDEGVPIDLRDPEHRTPLCFAAHHPAIVEWLLGKGAAVNPSGADPTPLGRAVGDRKYVPGADEASRILMAAGAKPSASEAIELLWQALDDGAEALAHVLSLGCDPNARDGRGRTLLHELMRDADPDPIARLLAAGADPNVRDEDGRTPLDEFAENRSSDDEDAAELDEYEQAVASLLHAAGAVRGMSREEEDDEPTLYQRLTTDRVAPVDAGSVPLTPEALVQVVRAGASGLARELFERGAKPSWVPAREIYDVSRLGPTAMLEAMFEAGLDPCWRTPDGNTLVHGPVDEHLHDGIVDRLRLALDRGAPIDATNDLGWTPLMMALAGMKCAELGPPEPLRGRVEDEVIAFLLERGARLDARSASGYAMLHAAALGGRLDLVGACMAAGMGAALTDEHGRTPLHEAARGGHLEICRALVDAGAPLDPTDCKGATALHLAIEALKIEVATFLIESGADLRARDIAGRTALFVAAEVGLHAISPALLERGAEVGARDHRRRTPLHACCESSTSRHMGVMLAFMDTETIERSERDVADIGVLGAKVLIDAGAELDAVDSYGQTPLHVAAEQRMLLGGKVDPGLCRCLLAAGADPSARDLAGRTPADLASSRAIRKLLTPAR